MRLLDFGLARPVEESSRVTQEGTVIGTPAYMAPEQAQGEAVDTRADLFSLGCVLYRLAVGRSAFSRKTILATLHAVLNHDPPPPHETVPAVPRPLSDLVMRLLAKDPAGRPASARETAGALAALESTPAATAGPAPLASPSPAAPTVAANRPSRRFVAAGLVVLLLVGLGTWLALRGRVPPGDAPRADNQPAGGPTGPPAQPPGQDPRKVVTGFQLYYGKDPALLARLTARMRKGSVAVIDARMLPRDGLADLVRKAEKAGTRLLAYLSVGELEDSAQEPFREFLQTYLAAHPGEAEPFRTLESMTLRRNEKFKSVQVDVLAGAWRARVLAEVDRLYATGVHGLFLDTVDTADLYIGNKDWPLSRRCRSVEAMLSLVRAIKARDRGKFVVQNRGLNLIGPTVFVGDDTGKEIPGLDFARGHPDNPDGILWENAFASQDEWSRVKERELREIRQTGRAAVLTLGYREVLKEPAGFFHKSAEAGFVAAWATSSNRLHEELTEGPPVTTGSP